jgi:membrane protease YdiL (CAAX protease family)
MLLLLLPVIALQVMIPGPLSEELGWRGYALDALQARYNALVSSLVLGLIWALWHLPLFFTRSEGNFYHEWGAGTLLFWLFVLRMTLFSVPITWVYNHTGRSILSAILFHFAYNLTYSLVYPVPEGLHLTGTLLLLGAAVGIVIVWGPRTLTRRPPVHRADLRTRHEK